MLVDDRAPDLYPKPSPRWDHDEILELFYQQWSLPTEGLQFILESMPDEELPSFALLLADIEQVAIQDKKLTEYLPRAIFPEVRYFQPLNESDVRIPVADRSTFEQFIGNEEVARLVSEFCEERWRTEVSLDNDPKMKLYNPLPDALKRSMGIPNGKISELKSHQPIDNISFLTWVGMYFWSESSGRPIYSKLWDTLPNIARDIPAELVVPMIAFIEHEYPKLNGDDKAEPVIEFSSLNPSFSAENGIVWQAFQIEDLRQELIRHLENRRGELEDEEMLLCHVYDALRNMMTSRSKKPEADYAEIDDEIQLIFKRIEERSKLPVCQSGSQAGPVIDFRV